MFFKKLLNNTETLFLLLFLLVFSYFGISNIMDHSVTNPYPRGLLASDPFHYFNYMEGLDDLGKFDFFPAYISYGKESVIAYQPPLYHVNSVILGNLFGIENYDSMNFLLLISLVCGIILLFYLIKRANNKFVAIISLPLALFLFAPNFIFGILWGRQPTLFTEVFLIMLFWFVINFDSFTLSNTKKGLFLGLVFSSLFLGHVPQFLFGAIFIGLFFLIRYLKNIKLIRKEWAMLSITAITFLIITTYYVVIFKTTVAVRTAGSIISKVLPAEASNRFVSFGDFGYFSIIILLGVAASLFFKNKKGYYFAYFMLIIGFTNYIIGKRGIEVRFMWPLFLCIFLGSLLYIAIKFIRLDMRYSYAVSAFVVILILTTAYNPGFGKGSLANEYNWKGIKFLQENTPKDSTVLFLYGDSFDQGAFITASKRLSYLVYPSELIKHLNNKRIDRKYESRIMGEGQAGAAYRKNGQIRFYMDEIKDTDIRDVCSYDYYILAKAGRMQQLAYYNLLIANELMKQPYFEKAFENELIVILHNKDKAADCLSMEGVSLGI